jgi:hypothetical protein
MAEYIEITPDLEAKLCRKGKFEERTPDMCSISPEDVLSRLIYNEDAGIFYFLVPPEKDVDFPASYQRFGEQIVFPYNADAYDISSRTIDINPQAPGFLESLDPRLQDRFKSLKSKVDLVELIEELSMIAKLSFEYDFELSGDVPRLEEWRQRYAEWEEKHDAASYKRDKGVCGHAGKRFRSLLHSAGLPNHIKYYQVWCTTRETYDEAKQIEHDTTVVVDLQKNTWFVVNSLSPTKQYNITPKEKLTELGEPFVEVEETNVDIAALIEKKRRENGI